MNHISGMIFNAGQRKVYKDGEARIYFPQVPYTVVEKVEVAPVEIHENYKEKDYVLISDVNEYIPGVTAKMVDWWWGNMEKGYHLWAPGEHYGFDWVVPPCEVGYEGSVEASYEFDPYKPFNITRLNMKEYPFTTCYEHCWISRLDIEESQLILVHMYQDVKEGIYWRSIVFEERYLYDKIGNPFVNIPEFPDHMQYESGRLNAFLPQLYELWKDHPDPWENIQYDLTTKQNEDGTWSHVHKNLSPYETFIQGK